MMQDSVAIVGAGLVGSGWAVVFARAGYRVRVFDHSVQARERVLLWSRQSLDELAQAGLLDDAPEAVLARISICDRLADALEDACYVQESVFETLEAKTRISLEMDALIGRDSIVGSSSSGIPASKFTKDCANRERFLIAHPVNPPHLVPVVELVPAPWTAPWVLDRASERMRAVKQVPVHLNKEIDGFVLNRLQGVLLNEAWALYEDGVASLADIDATIAHGLGLRWSFMGPFETIDLNAPGGIEDYAARLRSLYAGMVRPAPSDPWPQRVVAQAAVERRAALPTQDLAKRRDWRDAILTRLAAFKQQHRLAG